MEGDGVKRPIHWLGTRKFVGTSLDTCQLCSKDGICLIVDNSYWEYDEIALCLPCIQELFRKFNTASESAHSDQPSQGTTSASNDTEHSHGHS